MPVTVKVYEAMVWLNGHASGNVFSFYPIPHIYPAWSEPQYGCHGTDDRPKFHVFKAEVHEVLAPDSTVIREGMRNYTPATEPRAFGLLGTYGLDAESFLKAAQEGTGAFGLRMKDEVDEPAEAVKEAS